MSYISLMFKVVVVIVFWKDSLDFKNIIHNKKTGDGTSEVDDIIAQYS